MRRLLPLLFLLIGTGAGVGAGLLMTPNLADPAHGEAAGGSAAETPHGDKHGDGHEDGHDDGHGGGLEYVKLNNQFVIPVVRHGRIAALVVLSLSLEADYGLRETVYEREPKLRDAFLQVLFDHANMGGFDGAFTRPEILDPLREALLKVAHGELGPEVKSVLIVDIARQDN